MDIKDLTDRAYRALDRESFSSIKHLLDSPIAFNHYKNKPFKGSTATLLGTCIHHYLQGNRHLVTFSELAKTKKNEEAIKEFERLFFELAGEEGIIVPKSFEPKLNTIMKNFNENKKAVQFVNQCKFEEPFLFDFNGVPLKGKVDGISDNFVLEIKSSSQATTQEEFAQEARERDYDMQAYFYTLAAKKEHHFFLVVNTQDPFKVALYRSSYNFIASGHVKATIATERYKRYIVNGENWDGNDKIEEI